MMFSIPETTSLYQQELDAFAPFFEYHPGSLQIKKNKLQINIFHINIDLFNYSCIINCKSDKHLKNFNVL